jgi:hypothetical protein
MREGIQESVRSQKEEPGGQDRLFHEGRQECPPQLNHLVLPFIIASSKAQVVNFQSKITDLRSSISNLDLPFLFLPLPCNSVHSVVKILSFSSVFLCDCRGLFFSPEKTYGRHNLEFAS